jgi:NAD(P)-dependent dehydrogenase (short-subunit alcohol dehydrogenase family)
VKPTHTPATRPVGWVKPTHTHAPNPQGPMHRILVTGSSTGLGRLAARQLADLGHDVILHARDAATAATLPGTVLTADISTLAGQRLLAEQARASGPFDAIIHNAAVMSDAARNPTADGWPTTFAVNTVAPYVLTALIPAPARLIYLSSAMHRAGTPATDDLLWTRRPWSLTQAYSDTKLHVTMLALAVADRWPGTRSNAVNPGWVPTRMGGATAPDDLALGADTQAWLAAGTDPGATLTGHYLHHRRPSDPHPAATDPAARDALLAALAALTGVKLP